MLFTFVVSYSWDPSCLALVFTEQFQKVIFLCLRMLYCYVSWRLHWEEKHSKKLISATGHVIHEKVMWPVLRVMWSMRRSCDQCSRSCDPREGHVTDHVTLMCGKLASALALSWSGLAPNSNRTLATSFLHREKRRNFYHWLFGVFLHSTVHKLIMSETTLDVQMYSH